MMTERDYCKGVEHMLYSLPFLRAYVKSKEEELLFMEHDNIQGISYDGISTSQTYSIKQGTEDTALTNLAKAEGISKDIKRVKSKIDSIERSLELLDETQLSIIEHKYFEKSTWETVAEKVHKSINQVQRDNRRALKDLSLSFYGLKAIDKESLLNDIWC